MMFFAGLEAIAATQRHQAAASLDSRNRTGEFPPEASLWAFHNAVSFEDAVLKAVNLGDDADTTGAICGQLAGAFWGESNIPQSLRSGLARVDMLEKALAGIVND